MIDKNETIFNKQFIENKTLAEKPEESKTLFDKQAHAKTKNSDNLLEQIISAQKKCGKHPFAMVRDISRLQRGNGPVRWHDAQAAAGRRAGLRSQRDAQA